MKPLIQFEFAFVVGLCFVVGCGGPSSSDFSGASGLEENGFANNDATVQTNAPSKKSKRRGSRSVASRTNRSGKGRSNSTTKSQRNPAIESSYGLVGNRDSSKKPTTTTTTTVPSSQQDPLAALLGQPAPDVGIVKLDGGDFDLKNRRSSQILLLAFWTTTNPHAQEELPILQHIAAEYADKGVELLAVNDGENSKTIKAYLAGLKLKIPVAVDLEQQVATAFKINQLPSLVIIDKQGIVQSIHRGFIKTLHGNVKKDLDALLAGRSVFKQAHARLNGERAEIQRDTETEGPTSASGAKTHAVEDFQLTLKSGRIIDLKEVFTTVGKKYENRLGRMRNKGSMLTTYYEGEKKPFMLIGNTGGNLNGPTAAFYQDGSPMIYLDYVVGQRTGTLFTWDEQNRPWVFMQFDSGKKDGYAVAFRACSDHCSEGHIWLVQEWEKGKLRKSHLASTDGTTHTFDHLERSEHVSNDEYAIAAEQISEFDRSLKTNEMSLKKAVRTHGRQVARSRYAAATASQRGSMASFQSSVSMPRAAPVRRGGSC